MSRERQAMAPADADRRFRDAFQRSPLGKAILRLCDGRPGTILEVNGALCAMFGMTRDQLVGSSASVVLRSHPEDAAKGFLELERALHDGDESFYLEKRYIRGDGTTVAAAIWGSLIEETDGSGQYAVLHFQDITDRRRAATELHEAKLRFEAAFEQAPIGIAIVDLDEERFGELLLVNSALCELLGYPREELIGRSSVTLSHPDDIDLTRQRAAEVLRGEATRYELEKRYITAGGDTVIALTSGSVVRDEGGDVLYGIVHVQDLTQRRHSEEEAERLGAVLHQAQKLETVGQLAGGVAHDFNNILAVILNASDFALADLGDHRAADDIRAIRTAAERAASLTRQLLVFSRREIAEPRLLDLNQVAGEVERLLHRTIGEHIELVVRRAPGVPRVEADPSHLEQVLLNLAVNARDAMPDGGTLRVETSSIEVDVHQARMHGGLAAGRYAVLAVSDTGRGMAPELIERAFEPFFTTKPAGTGTGLGLATVYGIVTQMGGHVTLASEPGDGTVASVLLPAATGVTGRPPREEPAALEEPGGGQRILVVEDEEAVRSITQRILTSGGYRVLAASGPREALEMASLVEVDLVITDVVMPSMSGPQLVAELRKVNQSLPVVFMSGYTDRPGALPGDAMFLSKPFSRRSLLEQVGTALCA
jgi:PAS domain S-box-containing protein